MIDCVPVKGKKHCKGSNSSNPNSIISQKCIKTYTNECVTVSNGKLFRLACREQLSLNCSTINNHVNSSKHRADKAWLKNKQRTEMKLVEAFKSYDAMENSKGISFSKEQYIYCIKVVCTYFFVSWNATE